MNQVALVGNITDDPELRYTQSGAALAGFTVAVSHRKWVPSSVGSASPTATSTEKAEEQNGNGPSRAASQPSGSDAARDRSRSVLAGSAATSSEGQIVTIAIRRASQPSKKATPPNGVTTPHRRLPVDASA
jgi:hypothetical protein